MSDQENKSGLPIELKANLEAANDFDMSDVKVHRNSGPSSELQAHAYAQGTDPYLAPGEEKQLPTEAWHVIQQKQRRVRPTMQLKGSEEDDSES